MASNTPDQDRNPSDDEEAQLLSSSDEDYEQFELSNRSDPNTPTPTPTAPRPRNRPNPSIWSRICPPRSLTSHPPTVTPFFPSIQALPGKLLLPKRPWQRTLLFILFVLSWVIVLVLNISFAFSSEAFSSAGSATDTSGGGIREVSCTETLWRPGNECGLDGVDCRPFGNVSVVVRCPGGCAGGAGAGAKVGGRRYVGRVEVDDGLLVVGGGGGGGDAGIGTADGKGNGNGISPYRGDSFLCGAAIHAGVIDDTTGGCAVATLVGEYYHYFSSVQHGIESLAFDSYFPLSFTITTDPTLSCPSLGTGSGSTFPSLTSSILFTTLVFLFISSPALRFFTTFLAIFTHVALTSSLPPNLPPNLHLPTLLSTYSTRLLPTLFITPILYHTCIRPTLPPSHLAPPLSIETTALYLPPLWLGALAHHTLAPLTRLDLTTTTIPTFITAIVSIVAVIAPLMLLAHQLCTLYLTSASTSTSASNRPPYSPAGSYAYPLAIYALLALTGLILLAGIPDLGLDIHVHLHSYFVALLLLPCTAVQSRVSWICQGVLVGLFVNGVARGGLGSVLEIGGQTPGNEVGVVNGVGMPAVVPPLVEGLGGLVSGNGEGEMRIQFKWKGLNSTLPEEDPGMVTSEGTDAKETQATRAKPKGISVLVNDVERYRGWFAEQPLEEQTFVWTRDLNGILADEYFRFGFVTDGGKALEGYTEAGTWFVNGSWSQGVGYW
ncbi:LCCL domain-containing protein [Dichotomopilus funicola]|uniref:LCCL domain-containing protein n=1 Tax=Dichotomopilus funicola TaxID=1934379 RepID=A0AAN6ZKY6_9PEZI|nr:LCCL domain-containing protein [Dichotomopilus funicola]